MNKKLNPNFIGEWFFDKSLCEKIIIFFNENNVLQQPGISGESIDLNKKKSTDLTINPKDLENPKFECLKNYFNELNKCYDDYKLSWPFLNESFSKVDIGSFNIQKYDTGGHFSKLHSERMSLQYLLRLFAFMTYLNEDFNGGNTYLSHYDLAIKPETGKTLIWPAEWTHAHKGEIIKSNSKFIITGWLNIPF